MWNWSDFWINVIADIFILGVSALVGWAYVFLRRRPLLHFFGVSKSRKIVVYISSLSVKPGGAYDSGGVRRSYQGMVLSYGEVRVANELRDLFNYPFPSLGDRKGILNKLFLSDVKVQIIPSPSDTSQLESSATLITLGSSGYNSASHFLEKAYGSQTRFQDDFKAMIIEGLQPVTRENYGFIERVYDEKKNRYLFYVAGLSELGTVGAGYYLATEWSYLTKNNDDKKGLIIMLRFDSKDYRNWSIVFEKRNLNHKPAKSPMYEVQASESIDQRREAASTQPQTPYKGGTALAEPKSGERLVDFEAGEVDWGAITNTSANRIDNDD